MDMERPLTQHIVEETAVISIDGYKKAGGYTALSKALKTMSPAEVSAIVKNSGLLGRGGAGFPTGTKWSLVPMDAESNTKPKYLVCNADEMEPGTFKDRYLMEGNPHQLIEGMIIAAYAIQAQTAYIFIRWAYKKAEAMLRKAIAEAYDEGYLGKNIMGSGYTLDMYVHSSAGRYICGEETALLSSLEGKRAIPRAKPPYPALNGLFGRPAVVNNVETLSWMSHLVANGVDWFKGLSKTDTGGTKLFGVSGKVNKPGTWELPFGVTVRELIEDYAGGMMPGYKFRGALPGGASTDFLVEEHLDVQMDFKTVAAVGSRLGTGTMIILDDQTCPVAFIHNVEKFFALESCGWCTPCREGLPWVEKMLASIEEGTGKMQYLDLLGFQAKYMSPGNTFCAHAPGAVEPLQSGLKYFHDDFVKHINDKKCPWR
jgi:NADH-quinone oxidoreductase subunit F